MTMNGTIGKTNSRGRTAAKSAASRFGFGKAQAALALAVSLWMANGSVASATAGGHQLYLDDDNGSIRHYENYNSHTEIAYPGGATVTASGKTLSVTGGDWSGWELNGGYYRSSARALSGYRLNVSGTTNGNSIVGAWADYSGGDVTDNHLTIGNSTGIGKADSGLFVAGGYTSSGNAASNTVTIENSAIPNVDVYGGYSEKGGAGTGATGNTVTVTNSAFGKSVYGGYVHQDGGAATGNVVTVSGGSVSGNIYGGCVYYGNGAATGNAVTVKNATVGGNIYGGHASYYTTTGNTVTLDGATVTGIVEGGNGGGNGPKQTQLTGNTLQLSGQNSVSLGIEHFETIKLLDTVEWTPKPDRNTDNTPTLTANKLNGYGLGSTPGTDYLNLDVTAVAQKWTTPGTMVLIKTTQDLPNRIYLNGDTSKTIYNATQTVYEGPQTKSESAGVTLGYRSKHTLDKNGKNIEYTVQNLVNAVTFGTIAWDTTAPARTLTAGAFNLYDGSPTFDASKLTFTCDAAALPKAGDAMTLLRQVQGTINNTNISPTNAAATLNCDDTTGVQFSATAGGTITRVQSGTTIENLVANLNYTINSVALDSIDLANWNGTAGTLPNAEKWPAKAGGVTVNAGSFDAPADVAFGEKRTIFTTPSENYFGTVTGDNAYKNNEPFSTTKNGVTLAGMQTGGVKAENDGKELNYYGIEKKTETVTLGEMNWGEGRTVGAEYNFAGATIDASGLTFKNPETIAAGDTPLLTANDTLVDIEPTEAPVSYRNRLIASGVTMNGKITGRYASSGGNLTYTAAANQATKLTFTDVEWKDSGALLDHATTLTNVSFNGADVDTTNINFTNLQSLEANKKMTLVSSFGDTVGTITGTKYKVGSTLEGEGKASLVGNDLIFTAETGVGMTAQEQTHNTVMGAEVGMAALSAGNDFIGNATEGLALASNIGADGVSSFAQMGGGTMRQETGSHIDVHTWNAIIALGHQNKKERGTMEYGAFFEYGTGNYSTFNGDERGDGSTKYTGGGLLAKWTAHHGMYVEGSLRAGTVHDDARNVLRDFRGMPYSYEMSASYMGFHFGVGKEIEVAGGNIVDVYGKYFFNRRKGVSFDAGGHYDLDAVTSSVLRVGARYVVKQSKWNFYAGAAYEHELDGEATGKADGVAIRSADVGGGSFRGELGATMTPGDKSPWTLDLNLTGFAGKKRGFTGGVSVAFMF